MKFTLTSFFIGIIAVVVIGTIMLASCSDTPAVSTGKPSHSSETNPTATRVPLPSMSDYETGMVAPAWSHNAYSNYGETLHDIKTATNARWVELPVLLQQASNTSDTVNVSQNQVTPQSLEDGIRSAHAQGLRVFVVPLLGVNVQGSWSGTVIPGNINAWFTSYWQALKPYITVAEEARADQLSIGTELDWIQENARNALWMTVIGDVTSIYHGRVTYDSNWSEIPYSIPNWLRDSRLYAIGVSTYIDLTTTPSYIDPSALPALWKSVIQSQLDQFSVNLGKPVIISEIGYRDRSDALYHTWSTNSSASISQKEQAAAFDAALIDIDGDSHIVGFYPWGWMNTGDMSVRGTQAAGMIRQHYSAM